MCVIILLLERNRQTEIFFKSPVEALSLLGLHLFINGLKCTSQQSENMHISMPSYECVWLCAFKRVFCVTQWDTSNKTIICAATEILHTGLAKEVYIEA